MILHIQQWYCHLVTISYHSSFPLFIISCIFVFSVGCTQIAPQESDMRPNDMSFVFTLVLCSLQMMPRIKEWNSQLSPENVVILQADRSGGKVNIPRLEYDKELHIAVDFSCCRNFAILKHSRFSTARDQLQRIARY